MTNEITRLARILAVMQTTDALSGPKVLAFHMDVLKDAGSDQVVKRAADKAKQQHKLQMDLEADELLLKSAMSLAGISFEKTDEPVGPVEGVVQDEPVAVVAPVAAPAPKVEKKDAPVAAPKAIVASGAVASLIEALKAEPAGLTVEALVKKMKVKDGRMVRNAIDNARKARGKEFIAAIGGGVFALHA